MQAFKMAVKAGKFSPCNQAGVELTVEAGTFSHSDV